MPERWTRALPWLRLVRLPNVFTALADIGLGMCVAGRWFPDAAILGLGISSATLYCAGMVWNDFFDIAQDRIERPFRPLPSGQISRLAARRLGFGLVLLGILAATVAGRLAETPTALPALFALGLVAAIFLYDAWLKRTLFGPLAMGLCRFLNVLLGMSIFSSEAIPWALRWHLAGVVGVYISGVTWFARTEARVSAREQLRGAGLVILAAFLLLLLVPLHRDEGSSAFLFPYALVAYGLYLAVPLLQACRTPAPQPVQVFVKRAVLGLIAFDTLLALAAGGTQGWILLVLLWPALALGRWLYST